MAQDGDKPAELLKQLEARSALKRRRAAEALGRLGEPAAVGPLCKLLDNPDPDVDVHLKVVQALGRIGHPSAARTLVHWVVQEPLADSAEPAARVLVKFGSGALEALLSVFKDPSVFAHMCYPAWVLGEIGDPRAVDVLLPVAGHSDPGVREDVVTALGKFTDNRINPVLVRALERDDLSTIRCKAASALGLIGDRAAASALVRATYDDQVRDAAVEALGHLQAPEGVDRLLELVAEPGANYWLLCRALGEIADSRATPRLVSLLQRADAVKDAAWALARIRDTAAAKALREGLRIGRTDIVCGGLEFFVRDGVPGTESEIVKALFAHGGLEEAKVAYGSGNEALVTAAEEWAGLMRIPRLAGPRRPVKWGDA